VVWSLGHRNAQGIAWTRDGAMWASEFGQNAWDELNRIVPGGNYGWPVVEGDGDVAGFTYPIAVWTTDEASPSGIAIVGDTVFIAGLRGERLWMVDTSDGALAHEPVAALTGEQGRLRDVVAAPDGTLWVLTNNTDGRGIPGPRTTCSCACRSSTSTEASQCGSGSRAGGYGETVSSQPRCPHCRHFLYLDTLTCPNCEAELGFHILSRQFYGIRHGQSSSTIRPGTPARTASGTATGSSGRTRRPDGASRAG
jgi:hypothetical protein